MYYLNYLMMLVVHFMILTLNVVIVCKTRTQITKTQLIYDINILGKLYGRFGQLSIRDAISFSPFGQLVLIQGFQVSITFI